MVTNRQWGHRRAEYSGGLTGHGRQWGHRKGNDHEQAVGSQEGKWSRTGSGVTRKEIVTNRQWGHRRGK